MDDNEEEEDNVEQLLQDLLDAGEDAGDNDLNPDSPPIRTGIRSGALRVRDDEEPADSPPIRFGTRGGPLHVDDDEDGGPSVQTRAVYDDSFSPSSRMYIDEDDDGYFYSPNPSSRLYIDEDYEEELYSPRDRTRSRNTPYAFSPSSSGRLFIDEDWEPDIQPVIRGLRRNPLYAYDPDAPGPSHRRIDDEYIEERELVESRMLWDDPDVPGTSKQSDRQMAIRKRAKPKTRQRFDWSKGRRWKPGEWAVRRKEAARHDRLRRKRSYASMEAPSDFDPRRAYVEVPHQRVQAAALGLSENQFSLRLRLDLVTETLPEKQAKIYAVLKHQLEKLKAKHSAGAFFNLCVTHPDLHTQGLSTGFESREMACAEELTDLVLSAVNSDSDLRLEDMVFHFGVLDPEAADPEADDGDDQLYGGYTPVNFVARRGICSIDEFCRPLRNWTNPLRGMYMERIPSRRVKYENMCGILGLLDALMISRLSKSDDGDGSSIDGDDDGGEGKSEPPHLVSFHMWKRSKERLVMAESLLQRLHEQRPNIPASRVRGPFNLSELKVAAAIVIDDASDLDASVVFFNSPSAPVAIVGPRLGADLLILYLHIDPLASKKAKQLEVDWTKESTGTGTRPSSSASNVVREDIKSHGSVFVVKNLADIFGGRSYCMVCNHRDWTAARHLCSADPSSTVCFHCLEAECGNNDSTQPADGPSHQCPHCEKSFWFEECLSTHRWLNRCRRKIRCSFCFYNYRENEREENHVCESRCSTCNHVHENVTDWCVVRPPVSKAKSRTPVAVDESRVVLPQDDDDGSISPGTARGNEFLDNEARDEDDDDDDDDAQHEAPYEIIADGPRISATTGKKDAKGMIKKKKKKKKKKKEKGSPSPENVIYWDAEAYESLVTGRQEPIMIGVRKSSADIDSEDLVIRYMGKKCMLEFVREVMEDQDKYPSGSTFISHNGALYDHYLLLSAFLRLGLIPKILLRASAIILLETSNGQRFLDSYQFISSRLADMPGMFKMPQSTRKGHFPHKLCSLEIYFESEHSGFYESGDGELVPPLEAFGGENLGRRDREELVEWWQNLYVKHQGSGIAYNVSHLCFQFTDKS